MLHIKHNNNNTNNRFDHQCFRPHSLQATALSGHQNVKLTKTASPQENSTTVMKKHIHYIAFSVSKH